MKRVDFYLENLLTPTLKDQHIPYRFISKICDDIKLRMVSCLAYWEDEGARKTILFPSLEEAMYYDGPASVEEKQFVVANVRNSLLEIACSDDCKQFKINEPLSDKVIKEITTEASYFFKGMNFSSLSEQVKLDNNNVYKLAMEKYPMAWEYLHKLANLELRTLDITGTSTEEVEIGKEFLAEHVNKTVVMNGFTLDFDDTLKSMMQDLVSGACSTFYVDNFKMIARNFEKVLHVLEIVLQNNKVFCTSNYYVSRTHLERRKRIQRAAHSDRDFINNLRVEGAPKELSNVIEYMRNNIR